MIKHTTNAHSTANIHVMTIFALVAVGGILLARESEGSLRFREASLRRMKLCRRVRRNMIGPMNRERRPMFMSERAATAVERMTEAQRRLSICFASLENG